VGSAEVAVVIDRPADEVWRYAGDFGGLSDWMPGVDACKVEGDIRKLSVLGMDVSEKLLKRDDTSRVLEYSIVDSPLNADSHLGRVTVHEDGENRSKVTWFVEVVPDSLTDLLSGTYQQALDALKKHLEEKGG
jgi:carbon monoxide dehydrogenase subunit G